LSEREEEDIEERLSYDELSRHFFSLYLLIACSGDSALPVYSGDLSVALRMRHRAVKDLIEAYYQELQSAYGRSIQIVRHKRRGYSRAMRGYLLPFRAMVQLLSLCGEPGLALLRRPEMLFVCYTGESLYVASLN